MYHRQVARLGALEDAVNVKSRAARDISVDRAERHKSPGAGPTPLVRGRRPATSVSQLDKVLKHWRRVYECGIGDQEKGIDARGGHRRECRVDLLRTARVGSDQFEPE